MSCIKNGSTQKLAVDSIFFSHQISEESLRKAKEEDKYLKNERDERMVCIEIDCVSRVCVNVR